MTRLQWMGTALLTGVGIALLAQVNYWAAMGVLAVLLYCVFRWGPS